MRIRLLLLAALVVTVATVIGAASSAASSHDYDALVPGGVTPLAETVTVNIVYVGMGDPRADVSAQLPATSSPVMRFPAFYGEPADLGIRYTYAYNHVVAGTAWTAAFYAALDSLAGTASEPLSLFQEQYNAQSNAERTLSAGANQWLDAFAVEQYLAANPPAGVDTADPTIFFIDRSIAAGWYPHVYVKTNEPDPDTGYNFGQLRSTRKITAWGGTPPGDEENPVSGVRRVWFYDLSAGPDGWQDGWNVDDADVDGDGLADYRIPPAWHYDGGYAHPGYPGSATLGADLGRIVRFVGLDLLFTTSPLYPPFFNADRIPETVNLDVNTVEGWNGVDASATFYKPALFLAEENELPTGKTLSLDANTDVAFKGDVKNCYLQWVKNIRCYNDHVQYPAFANPFLNWALNTSSFLDGNADYEAGVINYAIGTKPKGAGFLGFADDNWLNGTQSGVFSFVYPEAVAAGYGLTTTMIHEYGHHSSMSHPHDGYDSTAAADDTASGPGPDGVFGDFGPGGPTYFAWLGDFSNSMMSYIDLNWDFSQFDRDNSARHHAAGFALVANRVADAIEGEPGSAAALGAADDDLVDAQLAFAGHDYPAALAKAEEAYRTLLAWADANGVDVEIRTPSTWTVLPAAKGGVGLNRKPPAGRIDLDDRHNAKRWR
jgi:hypothetical protein